MITFLQHSSTQYPPRTYENASADATIAFAFNFNTPGEILTKDSVKAQSKLYVPVNAAIDGNEKLIAIKAESIANTIRDCNISILNIAGNQLATCIKRGYNQEMVDSFVFNFLRAVFAQPIYKSGKITLIRSGGQSGFDEAGLKAAVRLGIPAICLCPRGWKFADINGKTICDERQFKNRFNSVLSL